MEHDAYSDAGADVRGAGGEIAEPFVECVGDLLLDEVVEPRDVLPGGGQVEPALHDLDAEMILLVDHHAEPFVGVDHDGA